MRLLIRWAITALSLVVVARLLPGIHVGSGPEGVVTAVVAAALLGLANALVKPLLALLSCPLILLTLGLFLFVINASMLMLASAGAQALGFPFRVDGWGSAIWGSIAISIVTWFLSLFARDRHED